MSANVSKKDKTTPRGNLTHIGDWRLSATLGRGAYGHVRLATHLTGRKAACKILPAPHHDPTQHVTWDQTVDAIEAHKEVVLLKALSGLNMPGVVELEGIVQKDGWTYMFSTLHPHSAAQVETPWDHDQLVTFFRRLCMTVHTLHALNVSHEDLKRSNVLVDPVGCPSLIDFGFSHFASYGQLVRSAGGTLDYSSPQKVKDEMYDGAQNDVWSLGIFLAKTLNIPHPYIEFDKDTESVAKKKITEGEPDFHFERHHMGPGGAASLIIQMLEPDADQRITIPEILQHPFLIPSRPDPVPLHLPSFELPSKLYHALSPSIIQDLCFLSYLNDEFVLCQTAKDVVSRLYGPEPCWEKRWGKLLSRWKKRADMDWEDLPRPRTTARSMIPVRTQIPAVPRRTVLRDIAQTSRINASNLMGHKDKATVLPSSSPHAKHAREGRISDDDSPSGRLDIFSRIKRHKRPTNNHIFSPREGKLPSQDKTAHRRVTHQVDSVAASPNRIDVKSPRKGNDHRVEHRAHRRTLAAGPRDHRRHRGASLLSEDSVPQGYPVMTPLPGPSNLITLDEAGPSLRQRNYPHRLTDGDLLGDSVEVMRGLVLESTPGTVEATRRPPPRRSSRIAEKKGSRVIR